MRRFASLPSTNDYAKEMRREGKDLLVIAKTQSGGRGTKGRRFESDEGGLYMTRLAFYEDFPANKAFTIMQDAAVAVCETLLRFGVRAQIKWPNDIIAQGKKICGILIENTFSGGYVRSSVVGIGLNVYNRFPEELQGIAVSILDCTGKGYSVKRVEKTLRKKWREEGLGRRYAQYLGFVGEEVALLCEDGVVSAVALGVDEEGNLLAKTARGVERFSSAEVSLRGGI